MDVRLELTGTMPLLMKNPQMADPENEHVQEIAKITAKGRRMTDDDRQVKDRHQWLGALYLDEVGQLAVPTRHVRQCLINAGKTIRKGTTVGQAISFTSLFAPLAYEGPRKFDELYNEPSFRYRTMVNANPSSGKKSMVPSVRPRFMPWALSVDAVLIESVLDLSDLRWIAERAGAAVGIGDNRVNGFGRFSVIVKEL